MARVCCFNAERPTQKNVVAKELKCIKRAQEAIKYCWGIEKIESLKISCTVTLS